MSQIKIIIIMGRFLPTSAAKQLGSQFEEASFTKARRCLFAQRWPLLQSGTVRGYEFDGGHVVMQCYGQSTYSVYMLHIHCEHIALSLSLTLQEKSLTTIVPRVCVYLIQILQHVILNVGFLVQET